MNDLELQEIQLYNQDPEAFDDPGAYWCSDPDFVEVFVHPDLRLQAKLGDDEQILDVKIAGPEWERCVVLTVINEEGDRYFEVVPSTRLQRVLWRLEPDPYQRGGEGGWKRIDGRYSALNVRPESKVTVGFDCQHGEEFEI